MGNFSLLRVWVDTADARRPLRTRATTSLSDSEPCVRVPRGYQEGPRVETDEDRRVMGYPPYDLHCAIVIPQATTITFRFLLHRNLPSFSTRTVRRGVTPRRSRMDAPQTPPPSHSSPSAKRIAAFDGGSMAAAPPRPSERSLAAHQQTARAHGRRGGMRTAWRARRESDARRGCARTRTVGGTAHIRPESMRTHGAAEHVGLVAGGFARRGPCPRRVLGVAYSHTVGNGNVAQ